MMPFFSPFFIFKLLNFISFSFITLHFNELASKFILRIQQVFFLIFFFFCYPRYFSWKGASLLVRSFSLRRHLLNSFKGRNNQATAIFKLQRPGFVPEIEGNLSNWVISPLFPLISHQLWTPAPRNPFVLLL